MPKQTCTCTQMPAPGQEDVKKPKLVIVEYANDCPVHAPKPDPVMLGDLP